MATVWSLGVELGLPRQRLLEGEQGGLEGPLQRRQLEALLPDPSPVGPAPVPAGEIGAAVAGQELKHPMAPAEDIAPEVVAAADEIAQGFFAFVQDMDGGEFAGAKQAHQLGGIASVGLDPLPGPARSQRRRDHGAGDAQRRDLTVEIVARDPGFIARGQGPSGLSRSNSRRICRGSLAISRSSGSLAVGRRIPTTIFRLLSSMAT